MSLFYPDERVAIFVDGPHIYNASKSLGFDIDYKKLHGIFANKGQLLRAFYYTAIADTAEFTPLKPLVDWLEYNGWKLVTKPLREYVDSMGRTRTKASMAVHLAVDALAIAPHVDHLVLFTADADFQPLVVALQLQGKRVTVVSTIRTNPPICADDLRRVSDNFVDLMDLKPQVERPVVERKTPNA